MRRDRDAGLAGEGVNVAHHGNAADFRNAGLDVIDGAGLDQPGEVGRRQHVLADGDRHAGGADLRRGAEILRRPDRLFDPFQIEFAHRRGRRQGFLQIPRRVDVDHQRRAARPAQQLRGGGDFAQSGLMHFQFAITAAERIFRGARHHRGVVVFEQAGIGRDCRARRAAEQFIDRQVGNFAENVPQCDVEPRQRVHHRAGAADAVSVAIQLSHEMGNIGRVGADADRRDQCLDKASDAGPHPVRKSLAPADDAGVGFDLDQ